MNAALAARVRQLEAERDHRHAVAEFRRQREADAQARIDALLADLIDALAQLPIEADTDAWPNQYTRRVPHARSAA